MTLTKKHCPESYYMSFIYSAFIRNFKKGEVLETSSDRRPAIITARTSAARLPEFAGFQPPSDRTQMAFE